MGSLAVLLLGGLLLPPAVPPAPLVRVCPCSEAAAAAAAAQWQIGPTEAPTSIAQNGTCLAVGPGPANSTDSALVGVKCSASYPPAEAMKWVVAKGQIRWLYDPALCAADLPVLEGRLALRPCNATDPYQYFRPWPQQAPGRYSLQGSDTLCVSYSASCAGSAQGARRPPSRPRASAPAAGGTRGGDGGTIGFSAVAAAVRGREVGGGRVRWPAALVKTDDRSAQFLAAAASTIRNGSSAGGRGGTQSGPGAYGPPAVPVHFAIGGAAVVLLLLAFACYRCGEDGLGEEQLLQVSHGLQLQSLWRTPTAAVS